MNARLAATALAAISAQGLPAHAQQAVPSLAPVVLVAESFGHKGFSYGVKDMESCLANANVLVKTMGVNKGVCIDTNSPEKSRQLTYISTSAGWVIQNAKDGYFEFGDFAGPATCPVK